MLPPTIEWYYRQHSSEYKTLPPYKEGCTNHEESKNMELIYPKESKKLFIPTDIDGKKSEIIFEVAHQNKEITLYWHLDNEYIGSTYTYHQKGIFAMPGKHSVTITDENGNSITKNFEILE